MSLKVLEILFVYPSKFIVMSLIISLQVIKYQEFL